MAEEKGKRPSKQQVNDIGSDLGIDLANAIGRAITTTLKNFDFGVLNKNLTKGLGTIDVSKALKVDSNKLKQLATDAKNNIEKSIGTISAAVSIDTSKVDETLKTIKPLQLQASITQVDLSEIDKTIKDIKLVELQALVIDVDTSLILEEVGKLNPITLQSVIQQTTAQPQAQPQQTTAQPQAQPQPQLIDNAQVQAQAGEITSTITSAIAKGFQSVNFASILNPLTDSIKGVNQLLVEMGKKMGLSVKQASTATDNYRKTIDKAHTSLTGLQGAEGLDELSNIFSELDADLAKVASKSVALGTNNKGIAQTQEQILDASHAVTQDLSQRKTLAQQLEKYDKDSLVAIAKKRGLLGAETMDTAKLAKLLADQYITTSKIIDLQEDLADSAADYAREIRQSDADIIIKDLTRRLHLSEQEVSQRARLLVKLNEQHMANGLLTEDQQEQIKLNGGLTDEQVKQLKNEDKLLKHKREQVEIVESLANWQLQLNEELEEYGKSWEKLKSKIRAVVTDPAVLRSFLAVKGIEIIKEKLEEVGEVFGEFRKEGLTFSQAMTETGVAIGASFSLTGVGMKDAAQIQGAMLKEQGSMKNITADTVQETGKLAKTFGLSNELSGKLVSQFQMMPGATAESATK